MADRQQLAQMLRGHDWYYAMSDDSRYYHAGRQTRDEIHILITRLQCPFSLSDLRGWALEFTTERFDPPGDNGYCHSKQGNAYIHHSALISPEQCERISAWLEG